MEKPHRIIVVGGGAGGLELATKLGQRLGRWESRRGSRWRAGWRLRGGRQTRAEITLIDVYWSHVWKPLLHEVAAGSLDVGEHQLEYLAQAKRAGFRFRLGRVESVDRERRTVCLAPTFDDDGVEITPRREFPYDTLVMAVGSVSNDFGVPGVREHCLFLDTTGQAQHFQRRLIGTLLRAHTEGGPSSPGQLDVAIVGGGATGVELAAQLHHVTRQLSAYGLDEIDPDQDVHYHIIESAPRLLPALPEHISRAVTRELEELEVQVHTNERVTRITAEGLETHSGRWFPAAFKVWAAGIKAPDFLAHIPGLETNRINQLVVTSTLQTTHDPDIFAMGDCAACPVSEGADEQVPPRAQAAHQQASFLAKGLERRLKGQPLGSYRYRDYGSLITLGRHATVGNLMGKLVGSVTVSGFVARMAYLSLHKMHELTLYGWVRTGLQTLSNAIERRLGPQVKLH